MTIPLIHPGKGVGCRRDTFFLFSLTIYSGDVPKFIGEHDSGKGFRVAMDKTLNTTSLFDIFLQQSKSYLTQVAIFSFKVNSGTFFRR